MLKHAAVIMLFLSSAGWGLTWLPAKALLDMGLGSQHFIFFAFGAGALVLLPVLWRQRALWLPHRKLLFAIGMVGGFAYVSFQTAIARGDTLGFVGTTGNAPKDTPHLHFQIMRWPADGKYWNGEPIDPFDFLGGVRHGTSAHVGAQPFDDYH